MPRPSLGPFKPLLNLETVRRLSGRPVTSGVAMWFPRAYRSSYDARLLEFRLSMHSHVETENFSHKERFCFEKKISWHFCCWKELASTSEYTSRGGERVKSFADVAHGVMCSPRLRQDGSGRAFKRLLTPADYRIQCYLGSYPFMENNGLISRFKTSQFRSILVLTTV